MGPAFFLCGEKSRCHSLLLILEIKAQAEDQQIAKPAMNTLRSPLTRSP